MRRAIINAPFVPFSILFNQVIQHIDLDDLDRLDRFAASLKPQEDTEMITITHPYRLYEILCRAARLYANSNFRGLSDNDAFQLGTTIRDDGLNPSTESMNDLNGWYFNSQEFMGLLDGSMGL